MVRKLIRAVKAHPTKTARQVMDEYDLSNLVSGDTTKRILRECELKGCIVVKKPALTKKVFEVKIK